MKFVASSNSTAISSLLTVWLVAVLTSWSGVGAGEQGPCGRIGPVVELELDELELSEVDVEGSVVSVVFVAGVVVWVVLVDADVESVAFVVVGSEPSVVSLVLAS